MATTSGFVRGVGGIRVSFTALPSNAHLPKLDSAKLKRSLDKYNQDFAINVAAQTSVYPPVPEESDYVRTGHLRDSWRIRNTSTAARISYMIVNQAADRRGRPYARLVHGPSNQWPLHAAHGWKNIADVMDSLGGRGKFRDGAQRIMSGAWVYG